MEGGPGGDAAGGVGTLDVAGADGDGGRHHLLRGQPVEQRREEAGDGAVAGAGGADDLHLEAGNEQLSVGPGGGVGGGAGADGGDSLPVGCGAEVEALGAQLQGDDGGPHAQKLVCELPEQGGVGLRVEIVGGAAPGDVIEPGAIQHEESLVEAGEEDVHVGKGAGEYLAPVRPAGL